MIPLKDIQLYMLDMDGTIYNENELIDGASDFFKLLKEQGKQYIFMTNNSSKSRKSYVEKLTMLGILATEENIASSVNATILYLNEHKPGAKLYLVGTESFKQEMIDEGFEVVPVDYRDNDIDYVLVGFDTELTYEKIIGACFYVSRGYKYIATNCDLKCPVKDRKYIPDCGSITNMIATATDRYPLFLGKPERTIVDYVSKKSSMPIEKIATVGDRLYTDIAVGINAGATTICVLSGEVNVEDLKTTKFKPDYCFESIKKLYESIK